MNNVLSCLVMWLTLITGIAPLLAQAQVPSTSGVGEDHSIFILSHISRDKWPTDVILTKELRVPIDNQQHGSGEIKLATGTRVRLKGVENNKLKVMLGSKLFTVLVSDTDLTSQLERAPTRLVERRITPVTNTSQPDKHSTTSERNASDDATASSALSESEQPPKLIFGQPPQEENTWFYHRMTPERRAAKLSREAGSDATEQAVQSALRWLKEHQMSDGSWTCGVSDAAVTALATLAFLGHGETPYSPQYGSTVKKALEFLASRVGDDGGVIDHRPTRYMKRGGDNILRLVNNMYVQAIVTEALAEGYGMTECLGLRKPLARAIAFIIGAQAAPKIDPLHIGGWRYSADSDDADLSVSSWQIMALKLGRRSAARVPRALLEKALQEPWSFGVVGHNEVPTASTGQKSPRTVFFVPDNVFEKARRYLWNMYDRETPGFGYTEPSATPSMTAVGIYCASLLGCGDDKRIPGALDYLSHQQLNWERGFSESKSSWYAWYFATQASFQGGYSHWRKWNDQLRKQLLPRQNRDGHWPIAPSGIDHIAGDTPVYQTALGVLIFETYYRYPRLSELDASDR